MKTFFSLTRPLAFARSLLAVAVALLAGLLATSAYAVPNEYRLGTGDVLRIAVYSQPDLTTEARVGEDGSIVFPLIGNVKLANMTPAEGARIITDRLRREGFITNPSVNLNVIQYRSQQVSVLGRVNRPGKLILERTARVSDALALAGGVALDGADTITLLRDRDGKTESMKIDLVALFNPGGEKLDVTVADGDIINVDRQAVFYIYGEVQRPGNFRLERDMTVVQALSIGGGLTPRGTQKGIRILRNDGSGLREIGATLADKVQASDVIYVKESLF